MINNQLKQVNSAFSKKSKEYESYGQKNKIVKWSRRRVYRHLNYFLPDNANILELNGGTGEDALFLASQGHQVHIIELADGMVDKIRDKISQVIQPGKISYQQQSFLKLDNIKNLPFDNVFSNFGGLNLTPDLKKVFCQLPNLLKPKGYITVVLLSKISIWELLTFFWNTKTALRRLPSLFNKPTISNVSGEKVLTYYFSPKQISHALGTSFQLKSLQGLCSFVPPSYFEEFPNKHAKLFSILKRLEIRWSHLNPISKIGDFFIATYQYLP